MPGWAVVAAAGLAALRPLRRLRRPADPEERASGVPGRLAILLEGAASLPWHAGHEARIRASAAEGAGGLVLFLGASHGLNVYVFFLLGPLMGKDVLLTHVVGITVWTTVAAGLLVVSGGAPEAEAEGTPLRPGGGPSPLRALGAELRGAVPALGWGLVLGSLIAAWGLQRPDLLPFLPLEPEGWTQGLSAGVGVATAAILAVPPGGNLFVAAYLWKVGLAHAGLVAFLTAAPLSLVRLRTCRRIFGPRGTLRLAAVMGAASLLAGLTTAALWGVFDLEIRYKLLTDQMWRF